MKAFIPGGLATGIGSTPFIEPSDALAMIRKYLPTIPHWPQLPRRGPEEGIVLQFLQPLVNTGLLVLEGDRAFFDTAHPAWPDRLTEFYTTFMAAEGGDPDALQAFAFPHESATGFYAFISDIRRTGPEGIQFLKGHIAGPLTIGLQVRDDRDRLAYYEDQLRDLIVKTLTMHARWQAAALAELGRPAILFMDDPAVRAYGSSTHITLTREMILEDLNAVFHAIHLENARAGLHSCDAIDWSLLFESDLDIVNLDTYHFGDSLLCYAQPMKTFLARGGIMAWGIVPTSDAAFEEDAETLLKRLETLWAELIRQGLDRPTLLRQSLITPACGTGLLSPELAERIYRLTAEISARVMSMAQEESP